MISKITVVATRTIAATIAIAAICTSGCRKNKDDGGGGGSESTASKVATVLNVQDGAAAVYRDKWKETGDTMAALNAMGNWIIEQPGVEEAFYMDESVVRIHYKNGLWSNISLHYVDEQGRRVTRGGGSAPGGEGYARTYTLGGHNKGTSEKMLIGSNKVLVFIPYFKEFYGYSSTEYPFLSKFDEAPQALEVTVVTEERANLDWLKQTKDFGLIILDTHGDYGSFSLYTGSAQLDELKNPGGVDWDAAKADAALAEAENLPKAELDAGTIEVHSVMAVPSRSKAEETKVFHKADVTYRYIRNMPMLAEAVVFGNHCFSDYKRYPVEDNLGAAWMSRGAISYYGHAFKDGDSWKVHNTFCVRMEDSLISNLVRGDSTGIAHLANNTTEQWYTSDRRSRIRGLGPVKVKRDNAAEAFEYAFTFQYRDIYLTHTYDPRYRYDCGGILTDQRDGQKYRTVCIGDQIWMAENLRWNAPGSRHVLDNAANEAVYGRLYTWAAVSAGNAPASLTGPGFRGVCPQGWHVPSRWDYDRLRAALVQKWGAANLGVMIKSKSALWTGDPTIGNALRDISTFAAMPAGIYEASGFGGQGEQTFFWLSSKFQTSSNPNHRGFFMVENNSTDIEGYQSDVDTVDAASCRCVKD